MSLPSPAAGEVSSRFDWPAFLVLTIAGSMISMALTGFVYPRENNIYHLAIALRLYDEPQYSQDAFIQSLRYYSSGLWPALQWVTLWIKPVYIFFGVTYISRLIYFIGFVACATLLGVRSRRELLLFTALICAAPLLRVCSYAGGDGLFSNFANHSDIANGVFLVALYFGVQGRIAIAITLTGLIFFFNLFKGVWTVPVFAPVILAQLFSGELSWRQGMVRAAIGICGASIIAAPVVAAILSNPELGKPLTFDYIAYLNEVFPFHFIFNSNPLKDRIALLLLALIGGGAFLLIGKCARSMLVAFVAICAVYAFGVIAPKLSQSPLLLIMHLLRIGGWIQLLSVLAASALATRWFFNRDPANNILGSVIIAGVSLPILLKVFVPGSLAVILFALADKDLKVLKSFALPRLHDLSSRLKVATIVFIICSLPYTYYRVSVQNMEEQEWLQEWTKVAVWSRDNTSLYSIFLVPPGRRAEEDSAEQAAASSDIAFEVTSHRRIWVDYRRGNAAMWIPSYYHEWRRRIREVLALSTHEDRVQYARQHGVNYVIDLCSGTHREDTLFATARLCVSPALSAE